MKIALIGGVRSTGAALEKLVQHGLPPHCVYGFEPLDSTLVSSYMCLSEYCRKEGLEYVPFRRINDHADELSKKEYDLIFVIGLSQLISEKILVSARLGCIGFHPTLLPRGRGRAPLAWLVLEGKVGAANLFLMEGGADAGPIFKQIPFLISESDDAAVVESKALSALSEALDRWLPELKHGVWNPVPQDELRASEYGVRKPEDGWIDWRESASVIERLVKASAYPHPGAYSFVDDKKLVVWACEQDPETPIRGVTGRVLRVEAGDAALVQTGEGLLRLSRYEVEDGSRLRTGMRLGYYPELEIYRLRQELQMIKQRIGL